MPDCRAENKIKRIGLGGHHKSLLLKYSSKHLSKNPLDVDEKKTLKRAAQHLIRQENRRKKEPTKENCRIEHLTEAKVDNQVKLRCRQLPNVLHELRKAIMRQDWDETATLLMILCHPGLKLYSSVIIKTCLVLLFHHPNSNLELFQDFVRATTGYLVDEDINKFIRILFILRKCPLSPLGSGKYVRKCGDYKVTRDAEFDMI